MDAKEFLALAANLAGEVTEAAWRSAASRAYYAAFHVARQLLSGCNFTVPRTERAHVYLTQRLMNSGHPDVKAAGAGLDSLRRARTRADYDLHLTFDQATSVTHVRIAEDVIKALEAAALEPVRTQITDAIKVYERDVLKDVTWHP